MSLWLEKQEIESLAAVRRDRNGTSTIAEGVLSCMKNFPGGNSSLGELLQTQQALQAAIDSLSDPVVMCGVAGELWLVNRAAAALLGRVVESRTTDPVHEVDSGVRPILERLRSHVLGGKGPYTPSDLEEAIRMSSGEGERYFLPRAAPVYETPGGIIGATVVLQDVTRLRRLDELRNDLVATVAHELRTPLTSLRMALQMCLELVLGPLTEKQAEALHAAREACTRLQTMVDGLLDLSRIEGGCVEMHQQPMTIAALVQAALETHRTLAAERGIQFGTALPLSDGEVFVDVQCVALVFSNLITNAIHHTPSGGQVTVCARPLNGWMRCEVADTGKGIPQKYHQRIFDKFFRVPGAPPGGAGLGLSIAQKIVQGHGGEIGVKSEEGHGSSFWFTLPLVATVNVKNATP